MDPKLLLVKAITLLYRESFITGQYERSNGMVKELIQNIQLPEVNIGFNHDKEILENLQATALYMTETPSNHEYDAIELLERLRMNTIDNEELYEILRESIEQDLSASAIKKTCIALKRTIESYFREKRIYDIVNNASMAMKFNRNKITNMREFVSKLSAELEPYMADVLEKDPAVISEVDGSNLEHIAGVFKEVKSTTSGEGIFKTGWKGLNRMLQGGFRRGEEVVIGALQHNWKTGMSLSLFKQIALYNKPHMIDKTKKPLLLRISAEDNLTLNFQFLYQSLKENETKKKVDLSGVTEDEMAAYVKERLSVNGYETRFMFINPSLWTYKDICNKVLELEAEGYEVQLVMLDYLLKIPTTGCDQGPHGVDIRNMYERVRNFMASRFITFITPHQLSSDAKMMVREGRNDFVKELVGKGYYAGTKQLDQVVDVELFIHIEKLNGKSYLTIQRGKHRLITQAAYEDLYIVLPFLSQEEFITGILDDINGEEITCRKVGGGPIGSKDEIPFWADEI